MSLKKKTDVNYHGVADNPTPVSIDGQAIIPPKPANFWDDAFKLSNAWAVTVTNCNINPNGGNREDGIDINRFCRDVLIKNCRVRSGDKYAVTIKGGSHQITLQDVTIHGPRGKEGVDIDIGNFCDWNYAMTNDITLKNVIREDGEPVRLRIGRGENVNIVGGNVKVLVVQSFLLKAYVWAKFWLQHWLNPKINGFRR